MEYSDAHSAICEDNLNNRYNRNKDDRNIDDDHYDKEKLSQLVNNNASTDNDKEVNKDE